MFLQTKFENKFCSSETISRHFVLQWKNTSVSPTCRSTTKISTFSFAWGQSPNVNKKGDTERKRCESLPPEKKVKILETDAAAHKKQRESLSPDDKVQILKKDADAHKKKQESLLPEDKDLFVKNHIAAQHKYCKTLSPDQNTEVLKINAAADKQQLKPLSPEQQGQIKSIDATRKLWICKKRSSLWVCGSVRYKR
jgi:hypothetical protein